MFQIFSQRDSRWANMKLGDSSLTCGRYGCTTCCISMLSFYFGDNLTPDQTIQRINYTHDGLVIWNLLNFAHFEFWFRDYGRDDTKIQNALADPNLAVILQVANGSHWVVATGKTLFGNEYKIADPWFGDRATTKRYGNITGAAFFKRK